MTARLAGAQDPARLVIVCNKCTTAACALGVFRCRTYDGTTCVVPVGTLLYLGYELPIYWEPWYAEAMRARVTHIGETCPK
jgi:hypothetical protein